MFSRINHREVDHKTRISKESFELATQKYNSTNPALLQPEQVDPIDYPWDPFSDDEKQSIPDSRAYDRLITLQKASDFLTRKLRLPEISQKALELCREVMPFEHGNIILKCDGKWKALHENCEMNFEAIFKVLNKHGIVESMFNKHTHHITSAGQLDLSESSMSSGKVLSLPMVVDSNEIGVCLIYTGMEDLDFSIADIEAVKIILRLATLAIQYQQMQEELASKENMISGLKKWLVRSTKMAIIGEIAKGLTHEINNPLQIILGKIQMAASSTGGQGVLKHVENQSLHIASLLRSFSEISRDRNRDHAEVIELNSFIKSTLEVVRKQIERRGIKLHYCFHNESNIIYRDPEYLRTLILNLAFEAKKRMHSGGELSVSTGVKDNGIIQVEFQDSAPKVDAVPDSDLITMESGELASVLLAREIGARIEFKNDDDLSRNRIIISIAPNT